VIVHLLLRLSVLEKRVLRRTFGPKRDEVIGGWRKLHNEGLHNLYSSPNEVNEDEMGKECSMHEKKRTAYRILMGKPEGKRPLGIPRRRWEDDIKMDLRETRWNGMTGLIWLRIGTSGGLLRTRQ
jgi:hypothetical protein